MMLLPVAFLGAFGPASLSATGVRARHCIRVLLIVAIAIELTAELHRTTAGSNGESGGALLAVAAPTSKGTSKKAARRYRCNLNKGW